MLPSRLPEPGEEIRRGDDRPRLTGLLALAALLAARLAVREGGHWDDVAEALGDLWEGCEDFGTPALGLPDALARDPAADPARYLRALARQFDRPAEFSPAARTA